MSYINSKVTHNPKLIILLVYAAMVIIVPPQHDYPINDDWLYAQSVQRALHGVFTIPDWSQASQLTHTLWGAGVAWLFGFSFTALTGSMFVLAALGSLSFYAILRRLDVAPAAALLGALLLACNPILIHLDYSFMTEPSFLTYTLLAVYCYLRGLQDERELWLWLGGLMSAVALLDRQFGGMVAVAAVVYLLLNGRLTLQRALAVTVLPALALISFLLWQHGQPPGSISIQTAQQTAAFFRNPLAVGWEHLSRLLITLPLLGLFIPLFAPRWRSRIFLGYATLLCTSVLGWYVFSRRVSFDYSSANIFDSGGFMPPVLYYFRTITLGPVWLWLALSIIAALLTAALFTAITAASIEWWQQNPSLTIRSHINPPLKEGGKEGEFAPASRLKRMCAALQPIAFVYLAGLLVGLPSLLLTPNFMDRYLVPLIPFVIIAALRRHNFRTNIAPTPQPTISKGVTNHAPRKRTLFYLASLLFYLAFSLLAQRDYFAYAQARWDAGTWVIAQGVPHQQLDGGYEWNGWWLYDQAAAAIRGQADAHYPPVQAAGAGFPPDAYIDPQYRLEISSEDGYSEVKRFAYTSWLAGGETRYVLVLRRK